MLVPTNPTGLYQSYHYVLNAQGDVVQLNYQGGTVYAQYTYDAYGNVLTKSGSLADVNPLRYRGYYCDTETGFYYLQSRYYDPAVRRFLNADSYGSTGQGFLGFNMFAYCGNNPVNACDHQGYRDDSIWSIENDEQGIIILLHWLYGDGSDLEYEDGEWGYNMRSNERLYKYTISIVNSLVTDLKPGEIIYVNITTSAEIENGESIIGYQYLHGTDADAGGYQITGKVGKDNNGNIIYDIRCTWNDFY